MKLNKSYLVMLAALGVVPQAFASSDDVNLATTNTVVVTAKRVEQDLLVAQPTVNVVKTEDKILKGVISTTDFLKDVPGVELVSDGTPGINVITIRGEKEGRTVLLVDGQRVDDHKTKSGSAVLVNSFSIDSIEVVKGPASVLYGSDAMGGVVNIIKKKASEDKFAAEGGVTYDGSGNGASEHLFVSGTLNNLRYGLSGVYTDIGDMYLSNKKRLDNTGFRNKGIDGFLEYDFSKNVTAGVAIESFDTSSKTSTTVDGAYKDFRANIPQWRRNKYSTFVRLHDLNDYVNSIEAKVFYQENDKDFNSNSTITMGPVGSTSIDVNTVNNQSALGGSLQADLSFGDRFNLITGYEYQKDKLDSDSSAVVNVKMMRPPMPTPMNMTHDLKYKDDGYAQDSNAIFALLSTSLTDKLTLNTGLRYTHVKTIAGTTTGTMVSDLGMGRPPVAVPFNGLNAGDVTHDRAVGSAGLVYKLDQKSSVRLNWSQGFRTPTIQELCLVTFTGEQQNGNKDLKAETSNNYELGYRFDDPNGINFDVAIFYNDAKDYITKVNGGTDPTTRRPVFTFANIAKAQTYGVETSLSWQLGDFKPYATLTQLQRKFEVGNISTYDTGSPTTQGMLGLTYAQDYDSVSLDLDINSRFAGETRYHEAFGYFGENSYGGYTTFNVSAAVSFGDDRQYTVFAGVENITDKEYQTTELIHEPGRFVTAGFNAKF